MNTGSTMPVYRDPLGGDAAVFLDWAWSHQARDGRRISEAWVRERTPPIPTFVVLPDDDAEAADWLSAECRRAGEAYHGGGHGTLLFVRGGRVIGWVAYVHRCGMAEIDRVFAETRGTGLGTAGADR